MLVEIESRAAQRVAALTHVGPYHTIGQTFGLVGTIAGPAGLLTAPGATMVAVYLDDPGAKPAAELRSEAGVLVGADIALPPALHEVELPAGTYARTTHVGHYRGLGATWARLYESPCHSRVAPHASAAHRRTRALLRLQLGDAPARVRTTWPTRYAR